MEQEHCHRLAHDIASADNYAVLAAHIYSCVGNKLHYACRGAGEEGIIAYHYMSHVFGVECVDVLFGADSVDNGCLVYLLGERELYQYAVYSAVVIELVNEVKKLCLGSLLGEGVLEGLKAYLGAGFLFVVHIHS